MAGSHLLVKQILKTTRLSSGLTSQERSVSCTTNAGSRRLNLRSWQERRAARNGKKPFGAWTPHWEGSSRLGSFCFLGLFNVDLRLCDGVFARLHSLCCQTKYGLLKPHWQFNKWHFIYWTESQEGHLKLARSRERTRKVRAVNVSSGVLFLLFLLRLTSFILSSLRPGSRCSRPVLWSQVRWTDDNHL